MKKLFSIIVVISIIGALPTFSFGTKMKSNECECKKNPDYWKNDFCLSLAKLPKPVCKIGISCAVYFVAAPAAPAIPIARIIIGELGKSYLCDSKTMVDIESWLKEMCNNPIKYTCTCDFPDYKNSTVIEAGEFKLLTQHL